MNELLYQRQRGILAPERLRDTVTVIGVGGIGSPTALLLLKMGVPSLVLYDNDDIEPHNLPNQLYRTQDIGARKVDALNAILSAYKTEEQTIHARPSLYGGSITPLIVSGVDSMASRADIWGKIKDSEDWKLYIDARMGGELLRIYTVRNTPESRAVYEATLYDDSEAEEAPCTEKAILYNTFACASIIGAQVKRYYMEEETPNQIIFDIKNNLYLPIA